MKDHEVAARRAFYTGKGLAAGDMNEQHIIDAFAAALAEAVRVAVEAKDTALDLAIAWHDAGDCWGACTFPLDILKIARRSEGAAPQATPTPCGKLVQTGPSPFDVICEHEATPVPDRCICGTDGLNGLECPQHGGTPTETGGKGPSR